jgi:ribosomal protein S18 acetylase RimI-like enzyme
VNDALTITLIEAADTPEAKAIGQGLGAHREAVLGQVVQAQPLCLACRDSTGALVAGLHGEVVLDWLYVANIWVSESLRGQGIGSRLLARVEAEAQARGAVGVHLYTSSFQAPDFYSRHGFTCLGGLAGRPAGHDRFWFAKRFDGQDPRATLPA